MALLPTSPAFLSPLVISLLPPPPPLCPLLHLPSSLLGPGACGSSSVFSPPSPPLLFPPPPLLFPVSSPWKSESRKIWKRWKTDPVRRDVPEEILCAVGLNPALHQKCHRPDRELGGPDGGKQRNSAEQGFYTGAGEDSRLLQTPSELSPPTSVIRKMLRRCARR